MIIFSSWSLSTKPRVRDCLRPVQVVCPLPTWTRNTRGLQFCCIKICAIATDSEREYTATRQCPFKLPCADLGRYSPVSLHVRPGLLERKRSSPKKSTYRWSSFDHRSISMQQNNLNEVLCPLFVKQTTPRCYSWFPFELSDKV